MTYHPHAINSASIWAWASGAIAATFAPVAGWVAQAVTTNPTTIAQTTTTVAQGGFWVGLLGVLTLLVNKVFEDRQRDRDERQRDRDHDQKLRDLQDALLEAKTELKVYTDQVLESYRERIHEKDNRLNERLLASEAQVRENTGAYNSIAPAVKQIAEATHVPVEVPPPIVPYLPDPDEVAKAHIFAPVKTEPAKP